MGPDFFFTLNGKRLTEDTLPNIAHALERIAIALEKLAKQGEAKVSDETPRPI